MIPVTAMNNRLFLTEPVAYDYQNELFQKVISEHLLYRRSPVPHGQHPNTAEHVNIIIQ